MPKLVQLAEGYGFVAGQVVRLTARQDVEEKTYEVVFHVQDVLATPITRSAASPKPNDVIRVRLRVGYAAEVEYYPPEKGSRWILTIKQVAGDLYEHAIGASAAQRVETVTDGDRKRFARLHELARVPEAKRTDAWVAVVADDNAGDELRLDVLAGLHPWQSVDWPPREEKPVIARKLRDVWNDSCVEISPEVLSVTDGVITDTFPEFAKSEERARVWSRQALAPRPDNRRDVRNRGIWVGGTFTELLMHQPQMVSADVVKAIGDPQWPLFIRWHLAMALRTAYECSAAPDPAWERAVQSFFAAIFASKDGWNLRLAAAALSSVPTLKDRKRTFVPDEAVRAAMRQGVIDMKAVPASRDDDPQSAARDVERVLKALNDRLPRQADVS